MEEVDKYRSKKQYDFGFDGRHGPNAIASDIVEKSKRPELNGDNPRVMLESDDATFLPYRADKNRKPDGDERKHLTDVLKSMDSTNEKNKKTDDPYSSYQNQYSNYQKVKNGISYGIKNLKEKSKSLYSALNNIASNFKRKQEEINKKDYEFDFNRDDGNNGKINESGGLYGRISGILTRGYDAVKGTVEYLKPMNYDKKPNENVASSGYDHYKVYSSSAKEQYVTDMSYFSPTQPSYYDNELESRVRIAPFSSGGLEAKLQIV